MNTRLMERFAPVLCGRRVSVVRDTGLLMNASRQVKVYYAPATSPALSSGSV